MHDVAVVRLVVGVRLVRKFEERVPCTGEVSVGYRPPFLVTSSAFIEIVLYPDPCPRRNGDLFEIFHS